MIEARAGSIVGRGGAARLALLTLVGCASPEATLPRHTPDASAPAPSSAAPDEAPRPLGSAARLFVRLDPAYRACATDGDCQLTADCGCLRCIPSKRMHVQPCPGACGLDVCAGRRAQCIASVCTSDHEEPEAPTAEVLEATRAAGQLVLDDPRFVAYLHAKERPERVPMKIAWEPRFPRPAWTVGGQPATLSDGLPGGPHLLPRLVQVEGDTASFELFYEPEGITVSAQVDRRGGRWEVTSLRVTER